VAAFCILLPSAYHTHLLALSNMLLQPVSEVAAEGKERTHDRKLLTEVSTQLSKEYLAQVLKYPFCTGEAQEIVVKQLKAKNVWEFVEQANSLGVQDIGNPVRRPSAQDAFYFPLKRLEKPIRTRSSSPFSSSPNQQIMVQTGADTHLIPKPYPNHRKAASGRVVGRTTVHLETTDQTEVLRRNDHRSICWHARYGLLFPNRWQQRLGNLFMLPAHQYHAP
jgi:hypothetical protein